MENELQSIEQAAQYRPGVASRIANLLTGGIYGEISGSAEKKRESDEARRFLLQETMSNRLMQRRRMENLLDQAADVGIPRQEAQELVKDPALLANRMNEIKMRQVLSQETGRQMGLTGEQGPIQTKTPMEGQAFSLGQLAGQTEKFKEERDLDESIKAATALGITIPAGANSGAIRSLISQKQAQVSQEASSRIGLERQGKEAQAFLQSVGQSVPSDYFQAIAAERNYRENQGTIAQRQEENRLTNFFNAPTFEERKKLLPTLTPTQQRDAQIRKFAGIRMAMPKDIAKEVNALEDRYFKANTAADSIQALVGNQNIAEVSQKSFNQLRSMVNSTQSKLFKSEGDRAKIRRILQNFEGIASGIRKDLFGASLTGNELESAKILFANRDSADFIPSALDFIDSVFSRDRISELSEDYDIPEGTQKRVTQQRDRWMDTRSKFKGWESQFGDISAPTAPVGQPGATNVTSGGKRFLVEEVSGQQ